VSRGRRLGMVEVVLRYAVPGVAEHRSVDLGATTDPTAVRAARDALLRQALDEVQVWEDVDAGLATVARAEAERVARILGALLPDRILTPELRLVKPETAME